jgi:DNA (cytosine-5)-methyltransferase 1
MQIGVVDLFCGIGGLSLGFKNEGFDIIAGVDSDVSCKFAYEKNIGADFLGMDVTKLTSAKVKTIFGKKSADFKVLVGCAPCTPFSLYSGRYHRDESSDNRWGLLRQFSRIVQQTKPDVISMENVPQLTRHEVFTDFVGDLEKAGYHVTYQQVRCEQYGIPQRRSRLVLIASRFGKVVLPPPTHLGRPRTVRDTIGDLPQINAGEPCTTDRLHVTRRLLAHFSSF